MADRTVNFDETELVRLRETCRALGTSRAEFIRFATLQALDECEALAREEAEARRAYAQANGHGR